MIFEAAEIEGFLSTKTYGYGAYVCDADNGKVNFQFTKCSRPDQVNNLLLVCAYSKE